MSTKSDARKRKAKLAAKKNLAKMKVKLARVKARARAELARHARAFKLAAKRYKVALRNS